MISLVFVLCSIALADTTTTVGTLSNSLNDILEYQNCHGVTVDVTRKLTQEEITTLKAGLLNLGRAYCISLKEHCKKKCTPLLIRENGKEMERVE